MIGSNPIRTAVFWVMRYFTRGSAHVNRLSLDVSSIKFKHQERSCEIQFKLITLQLISFIICKSIQDYAYHILDNIRHPFFSSIHYNMMPPILLPLLLLSVTISARELPSSTRVRNNSNNASRDLIETEEIKVEEPCSMSMIMSTLAIEEEERDNDGYIQAWPSPFEKLETSSPTPSSTVSCLMSI